MKTVIQRSRAIGSTNILGHGIGGHEQSIRITTQADLGSISNQLLQIYWKTGFFYIKRVLLIEVDGILGKFPKSRTQQATFDATMEHQQLEALCRRRLVTATAYCRLGRAHQQCAEL